MEGSHGFVSVTQGNSQFLVIFHFFVFVYLFRWVFEVVFLILDIGLKFIIIVINNIVIIVIIIIIIVIIIIIIIIISYIGDMDVINYE